MSDCPKCKTLRWCVDHGSDGVILAREAELDQLRAELRQARSVIALHQQNGCGIQLMKEGEYDRVCAERDAALEQRDHLSWLLAEAQDALAGSPTYGYTRYSQLMEKIDEARRLVTGRTEETS